MCVVLICNAKIVIASMLVRGHNLLSVPPINEGKGTIIVNSYFSADRYRCSSANNWSAGADHSAAHDPSSCETTPVGVF